MRGPLRVGEPAGCMNNRTVYGTNLKTVPQPRWFVQLPPNVPPNTVMPYKVPPTEISPAGYAPSAPPAKL
jgi:hypothetical protein